MEKGNSAWWDDSWNISAGCLPVTRGCDNCWAAKRIATLHQSAGPERAVAPLYDGITDWVNGRAVFNGRTRLLPPGHPRWSFPLTYPGADRPVLGPGKPSLIWCADTSDLFYRQPPWVLDKVVDNIAASQHIGLILTQRPGRMARYFLAPPSPSAQRCWLDHFWLGTSVCDQETFDARWPHMRALAERGYLIFINIAPMLGPVVLPRDLLALGGRVWILVAGEEGRHEDCRDLDPDWVRAVRDQCAEAGTPLFVRQMSRKAPIPVDLMIRQFPEWPPR